MPAGCSGLARKLVDDPGAIRAAVNRRSVELGAFHYEVADRVETVAAPREGVK